MALPFPMDVKQQAVWGMLRGGLTPGQAAEKLRSRRQYVHQLVRVADASITKTLRGTAQRAGLQVRRANTANGILLAYDPALQANVVITYTNKNGVRVWHWYEHPETVQDQPYLEEVRAYLLNEAEERGLNLTPAETQLHPAKLAQLVFARLLPGVGP